MQDKLFKILNQYLQDYTNKNVFLILNRSTRHNKIIVKVKRYNWRPPSLSELTPMLFSTRLTHLWSEASNLYGLLILNLPLRLLYRHI